MKPSSQTYCKHCGEQIKYINLYGWNHLGRGALCFVPEIGDDNPILFWAEPKEETK